MKKVVYSISKLNKFGSNKMTGVGFITESDLVIACVSQKGNPYIRVVEDLVKICHAIPNRETAAASLPVTINVKSKSNIPYGIN